MRSFLFIVLETASRALHYNKAQYVCSNKSKSMRMLKDIVLPPFKLHDK